MENNFNFGTQFQDEDDFDQREFDELIVNDAKSTYSRVFGALALYSFLATALMTVLSIVFMLVSPALFSKMFGTTLGIYLLNAIVLYAVCTPIFYFMVRNSETRRIYKNKISAKDFLGILAIAQTLMILGNYIGIFFNSIISSAIDKPITNTTVEMIDSSPIWVMIVFSVILAPIFEELLMRKLLIDRLSKYGTGFAVVVSAVAFGLFHGNFYQFFYAMFLGFILGFLYVKGGLKYSILLHMTINFLGSVAATLYNRAAYIILNTEDPTAVPAWASLVVLLYMAVVYGLIIYGLVLIVLKAVRRELRFSLFNDARLPIPKGSLLKCIFGNVGMILFLIVSALSMLMSIYD